MPCNNSMHQLQLSSDNKGSKVKTLNIAARREAKGMTREQLATKCKVTVGYLSSAEVGKAMVSENVAERLAKALGMRISVNDREAHNAAVKKYLGKLPSNQPKAKKVEASPKAVLAPVETKKVSAPKTKEPNLKQPTLPGFLDLAGINARVEEMVAQMLFERLTQAQPAAEVESEDTFNVTPIFKKA